VFRTESVETALINTRVGIQRTGHDLALLLTKMQLPTVVAAGQAEGPAHDLSLRLTVTVPPVRPDVLHECDIWEDAAIAHGYNNIVRVPPKTATAAKQQPVNKLTDQLRGVVAQAGFCEALTFALVRSHLRLRLRLRDFF
jgi:phenylalanyl-tRNA synthetase beta chain